ncbi:MAG: nicotinate-nicotinamide nucleotide adenylyltransferase, partial [Pyrinomonadaceae bacterium]
RCSTVEIEAPERPYTVDTLARIRAELGEELRLFFVMGADSWTEITTWREWERVLALCNHIVVTRPGYKLGFDHVTSAVRERIIDLREARHNAVTKTVDENPDPRIYITDAVMIDIS